jgi:Domain of unknown function (DUF5666)
MRRGNVDVVFTMIAGAWSTRLLLRRDASHTGMDLISWRILVKTLGVMLVLTVLGSGGTAAAQTTPQAPAAADKAASSKKPAVRSIRGTVKSTSTEAVVVTGRDKGKELEWTFAVEPTTDIRKGTKSIIAADLKSGDAVQVRFTEQDGRALARSILVSGKAGTPAKKPKP